MSYRIKRFFRAFQMGYSKTVFYEHRLGEFPEVQPKTLVKIKLLDITRASDLNQIKTVSEKKIEMRFKNGDLCFITEKSGKLLSFHWLQTQGRHYVQPIGQWIDIKTREAVIYDVHVNKNYRGLRINGFVYSNILTHCRNNFINRVWIYTDKSNIQNIKGLNALNFHNYGYSFSIKFNNKYRLIQYKET